jgi:hypothetical protein
LVLRGEYAPAPTRILAERLAQILPLGRLRTVEGCGHMGPVTHADRVMSLMAAHIETVACLAPRRETRRLSTSSDFIVEGERR